MLVEDYSTGYYVTEVMVEPHDRDVPCINDEAYRTLQFEIYDGPDEHGERVMFKLEDYTFEVEPHTGTPSCVLNLPLDLIEETRIRHPPARRPAFVVKPWAMDYVHFDEGDWEYPSDSGEPVL